MVETLRIIPKCSLSKELKEENQWGNSYKPRFTRKNGRVNGAAYVQSM